MAKKRVKKSKEEVFKKQFGVVDKDNKKLFAFFASFFTIIGFIIALVLKKNDEYVMFYAKQGLILFIGQALIWVVSEMPFTGRLISPILWILWLIVWIITWINALSGEQKPTFLIGDLANKLKL